MLKALVLKALAAKFLKGKLTNLAAAGTIILPVLQVFGVDVLSTEWDAITAGALAIVTIYGRARAKYQGG